MLWCVSSLVFCRREQHQSWDVLAWWQAGQACQFEYQSPSVAPSSPFTFGCVTSVTHQCECTLRLHVGWLHWLGDCSVMLLSTGSRVRFQGAGWQNAKIFLLIVLEFRVNYLRWSKLIQSLPPQHPSPSPVDKYHWNFKLSVLSVDWNHPGFMKLGLTACCILQMLQFLHCFNVPQQVQALVVAPVVDQGSSSTGQRWLGKVWKCWWVILNLNKHNIVYPITLRNTFRKGLLMRTQAGGHEEHWA